MRRIVLPGLALLLAGCIVSGCVTDPNTGKQSVDWNQVATDTANAGKVLCLVNGVVQAADPALAQHNQDLAGAADRVCAMIGGVAAPLQPVGTGVIKAP